MRRRSKLKTGGTSISFRPIGSGLSRGEQRLKEQADIRIQAIQLEKERHKEVSNIKIEGFADKVRFEEGVQKKKDKLEGLVRDRQVEALSIKADRDVGRLKDIAKQKEDEAKRLEGLIPETAKLITAGATLGLNIGEKLAEWSKRKELNKNRTLEKNLNLNDGATNRISNLNLNEINEQNQDLSYNAKAKFNDTNALQLKNVNAVVLEEFNKNPKIEKSNIHAVLKQVNEWERANNKPITELNEYNYDDFVEIVAFLRLEELGVNPNTKAGQKILSTYRRWGAEHVQGIKDSKAADRTSVNLEKNLQATNGHLSLVDILDTSDTGKTNRDNLTNAVHSGITDLYTTGVEINKTNYGGSQTVRFWEQDNARMYATVSWFKSYAEEYGHQYRTFDDFKEAFSSVRAFDVKKNGENVQSKELLIDKISPANLELIEKSYNTSHDNQETNRENESLASLNVLASEFEAEKKLFAELSNKKASINDYREAGIPDTLEELKFKYIDKVLQSTAPSENKKAIIRQLHLMSPNGSKYALDLNNITAPLRADYYLEGNDYEQAKETMLFQYYQMKDGPAKKALRKELKPFFDIDKAGYTHIGTGNSGILGWGDRNKQIVKEENGKWNSGANISGAAYKPLNEQQEQVAMRKTVLERQFYQTFLSEHTEEELKNDPSLYKKARIKAWEQVTKLWNDGRDSEDTSLIFARTSSAGHGYVYHNPLFNTLDEATITEIEKTIRGVEGASPWSKWKNVNQQTINGNDLRELFKNRLITKDEILSRADLIGQKKLNELKALAVDMSQPIYTEEDIFVSAEMPAIAYDIADILTEGTDEVWTATMVVNYLLEHQTEPGEKAIQFAPKGDAIYFLQGKGKIRAKNSAVNFNDRFGISMWGGFRAQNVYATKENLRLTWQDGIGANDALSKSLGVDESTKAFSTDYWSKGGAYTMSKDEIIDSFKTPSHLIRYTGKIPKKPPKNYGLTKEVPKPYLINQRSNFESQLTDLKNNKPKDKEDIKEWKGQQKEIRNRIKKLNIKIKEFDE